MSAELQQQSLNRENPWPGLAPFDEIDREYFHGRGAESAELMRLVRRELLTVLFGRSGLGKTSLLKAGLFPRLRDEDYLPVYIRLDHDEAAPTLREQVFRALQAACDADRVQVFQPNAEESLWSVFHRRDAELWSERNRLLTPVLVLDQFEEIFTLGQETESARARSVAFLAQLGDLVENRPPENINQALEADPSEARRFDFKSAAVKLVLSFREDFLAEIEGLKEQMPSLMYNRFRLLAMSGSQAYEAITRGGGHLVDDTIARQILRLAWKNEPSPPVEPAEFARIEIDPALLSVVCSELNLKRQTAAPPLDRITRTLLEGADREILTGFYERAMAGLDSRVRSFVEDELITVHGHRDSRVLEDALTRSGITPEAINMLIRRRLLRMDERQSLRRLELTHDVLTSVVKDSRDTRRTREAEEAAKTRDLALRRQQRRTRRNAVLIMAGVAIVILLIALSSWLSWQSARLLQEAHWTRLMANADRLQDTHYDASLLVNLEAMRTHPTLDAQAGLLRRFASHPHLLSFLNGQGTVWSVAFSPNGKWLASAGEVVTLTDAVTGTRLATLKGHKGEIASIAFSPDGKWLASAGEDKTIILWDMNDRKPHATLKGHRDQVASIAFSPDGKRLASASDDKTVVLWDVNSQKPLGTFIGHKNTINSVVFHPGGRFLASVGSDGVATLWDVETRKPLYTLDKYENVNGVAFSPDGKSLALGNMDDAVILWDLANHKQFATLDAHRGPIFDLAFSPDGKSLASASMDHTVVIWDVARRKPLHTLRGHSNMVGGVAFSPDGKRLASAGLGDTLILWDIGSRKLATTLNGHKPGVVGFAFSRDGKRMTSLGEDRVVNLWDLTRRESIAAIDLGRDSTNYSLSDNGDWLSSTDEDGTVTIWRLGKREPVAILKDKRIIPLGVMFGPDGHQMASVNKDQTITLWDLKDFKPVATISDHKEDTQAISFSPDGKRLVSMGIGEEFTLWDLDTHKVISELKGHRGTVMDAVFSHDGKLLASVGADSVVILWDVYSNKQLAKLEGHKGIVFNAAFSPDGKWLASTGFDESVILWDVSSHEQLVTLKEPPGFIPNIEFSPDGKQLATGGDDGTVTLWDLDLDSLRAEACQTANRNLTCEEWRNYIGVDTPYHKTCDALPGPKQCNW